MSKRAWYLGCDAQDIAERAILLGDPGRVRRMSTYLDNVEMQPVNRGLAMVTGEYHGTRVTLAAFGMGAPIATIVLHELAQLGCHTFLRMGTCMCIAPVRLGEFVIAQSAYSFEGTSPRYNPRGDTPTASAELVEQLRLHAIDASGRCHVGPFASYDAFYVDMFALDAGARMRVSENLRDLKAKCVLAVDMETSALLTAGTALKCQVSSLCVASVDSVTHEKLAGRDMDKCERKLAKIAFNTLHSMDTKGNYNAERQEPSDRSESHL